LVLNPNGKKLSKRDASSTFFITVQQFQEEGFLPEALLNFIAMVGRNPGTEQEFFTLDELIEAFSLERVVKSNAVYDFTRALRYNGEYLKKMPDEAFVTKLQTYLRKYGDAFRQTKTENIDTSYRLRFAPHIKVRLQTFGQFRAYCQYFFERVPASDELVYREKMKASKEIVKAYMPALVQLLEELTENQRTVETIKEELFSFITTKDLKNGQVLRPLRAILTGVETSP